MTAADVRTILAARITSPRLEVVDCPFVPPNPGLPSVTFTDAASLNDALDVLGPAWPDEAATVTVYLKRQTREPGGGGVLVAEFAAPGSP